MHIMIVFPSPNLQSGTVAALTSSHRRERSCRRFSTQAKEKLEAELRKSARAPAVAAAAAQRAPLGDANVGPQGGGGPRARRALPVGGVAASATL